MASTVIRTITRPFEVGSYASVLDLISHYNDELVSYQKLLIEASKKKKDITYLEGAIFVIENVLSNLRSL